MHPIDKQMPATPDQILDDLLSQVPIPQIQAALFRLPVYERYSVLCRACMAHQEITATCHQASERVETLLNRMCPFHFPHRPCGKPLSRSSL